MSNIPTVTISELFDSGVHFGHKTARWNPKMAPYIYDARDDIHVIDLRQTAALIPIALQAIYDVAKKNGKILFVSTKIQASEIIAEYAEKCGQHYINNRWLGGTFTNWITISNSIKTLDNLDKILNDEEQKENYTKKELLDLSRRRDKLLKSLGGIRHINGKPDLMLIIDTNKEHLAIDEALKLKIPLVAVLDSNSNPDNIDYPIPGNDDAIRSIKLYCRLFCDAVLAGMKDALIESGVDLGEVENFENNSANAGNASKLKSTKKISKAIRFTGNEPVNAKSTEEFTQILEKDESKK